MAAMAHTASTTNSLFYDLLVLSRFTKYNPVFTTFAGGMYCCVTRTR